MRRTVWTISNLLRRKPRPPLSATVAAVPTLVAVLQLDDVEVLTDCCWALSYLTDGSTERVQVGVTPIQGCNLCRPFTIAAALIMSIDPHVQVGVTSGCVPRLVELLSHSTAAVRHTQSLGTQHETAAK